MEIKGIRMKGSAYPVNANLPETWEWRWQTEDGRLGVFVFEDKEVRYDDGSDMLPEDYEWEKAFVGFI